MLGKRGRRRGRGPVEATRRRPSMVVGWGEVVLLKERGRWSCQHLPGGDLRKERAGNETTRRHPITAALAALACLALAGASWPVWLGSVVCKRKAGVTNACTLHGLAGVIAKQSGGSLGEFLEQEAPKEEINVLDQGFFARSSRLCVLTKGHGNGLGTKRHADFLACGLPFFTRAWGDVSRNNGPSIIHRQEHLKPPFPFLYQTLLVQVLLSLTSARRLYHLCHPKKAPSNRSPNVELPLTPCSSAHPPTPPQARIRQCPRPCLDFDEAIGEPSQQQQLLRQVVPQKERPRQLQQRGSDSRDAQFPNASAVHQQQRRHPPPAAAAAAAAAAARSFALAHAVGAATAVAQFVCPRPIKRNSQSEGLARGKLEAVVNPSFSFTLHGQPRYSRMTFVALIKHSWTRCCRPQCGAIAGICSFRK